MIRINRKAIAAILAAMLVAVPLAASAATFGSITSDSIKDKQNQISKAEEQKEAMQNSLTDIKKLKEELESKKKDLKNYVAGLDANLDVIQEKITELKGLIEDKEEEIARTEIELEDAQAVEDAQYEAMKVRLQLIYENGSEYFLEVLFGSSSFADMLNKMEYVDQLSAYEKEQFDNYVLNRQLIEACKAELEAQKEVLDEAKKVVDEEEANLESLIADKKDRIKDYESDITNKEKAIKEYEEEIAAQNELIVALEAAVAAEKKRILAESGVVLTYDGGVFKFPLASYTRISDEYGWRIHPTLGVEQFHNGVDLASPTGTAIYAAYDGIVVAAAYSTTMGNYVMIDHGDGLYTIYMHASALYVSTDDIVVKGETIAAVGSTGRSTGPHLHFSVRLNGEYVSPFNYLSQ